MLEEKLYLLACPRCKGELVLEKGNDMNGSATLVCRQCQLVYEIQDGIPNLSMDAGTPLENTSSADD